MPLTDEDKEWLDTRIGASEARMLEAMRTIETALLTAFQQWASPMEARQRTHSAAFRAIDAEMEALDDRVKKLERPEKHQ